MGSFFRKSVSFGPIRLNFSKSGIGVSAGVKGARISAGPRGTYIHAGRNGFYYRQRVGVPPSEQHSQPRPTDQGVYAGRQAVNPFVIETADVSELRETSITDLLDQINERATKARMGPLAVGVTVPGTVAVWGIALAITTPIAESIDPHLGIDIAMVVAFISSVLFGVVGLILSWRIHKGDELERTTPLFYELEPAADSKFRSVQEACRALSSTSKAWRVHTNQPTWDWKRNAGASNLVTRAAVQFGLQSPPYIATNVDVWSMALSDLTLFFLPDYIFVRQRKRYGAISYSSLVVSFSPTQFVEDQGVPPDAQVVDYTWRYVNKKGGPDRRFANNFQIPIVQYGFLQLQSNAGLNIHLHISSLAAAHAFADGITSSEKNVGSNYERHTRTHRVRTESPYVDQKIKIAFEVLGLETTATREEVVSAYRNMAKMYHPDKLYNLAPEFIQLAEERMKEINAAYEVLKRRN